MYFDLFCALAKAVAMEQRGMKLPTRQPNLYPISARFTQQNWPPQNQPSRPDVGDKRESLSTPVLGDAMGDDPDAGANGNSKRRSSQNRPWFQDGLMSETSGVCVGFIWRDEIPFSRYVVTRFWLGATLPNQP